MEQTNTSRKSQNFVIVLNDLRGLDTIPLMNLKLLFILLIYEQKLEQKLEFTTIIKISIQSHH